MRFGYTIIYVPDVPAALEFYQEAFDCSQRFLTEDRDYGELATGQTTLAFASEALREANGITSANNRREVLAAGIEIAFVSDDVDQSYRRALDAGAVAIKKPETMPWGQTVSYVRDLNGVLVEICSPVG